MTVRKTGYPSIDKPWLKYYEDQQIRLPDPECSLYEYIWECNKDHLDKYALDYFGKKISYRKLFSMIDEAARAFIAVGVKEKEIVPIVSISTVTSIICFYALNKIGAVSDYLNVLSEENDLQALFKEVDAKVVVTLDIFGEKVVNAARQSGVNTIITFGVNVEMPFLINAGYKLKSAGKIPAVLDFKNSLSWKDFIGRAREKTEITFRKNPEEICLLAHTGGTTGIPKAVMLSDTALNKAAETYIKMMKNAEAGDIFLQVMIPFVVYGILSCTHVPLVLGFCLAIIPKFEACDWEKYLKKIKPNHILAVPAYVRPLLENEKIKKISLASIKNIAVGGDGINDELEEGINDLLKKGGSSGILTKGYGMTEECATAIASFTTVNKVGSIGIPLPGYNTMIYDGDRRCELSYREVGEICIQSPSRMIGYLNNEEATNALFITHSDGSEWLHTGDLGYIDEDGFVFLIGRIKRMILTTKDGVAYKVFPNVPEDVLEKHESVKQSCIVGARDGDDQVLRAYIVISSADKGKEQKIEKELRDTCDKLLPSYSRPAFYRFCESLPLTAAGKVDYRSLED